MVWLAAGLWAPLLVAAQGMVAEPSAAVHCLTPGLAERGAPEYPFQAFKLEQRGRVKVMLIFRSPEDAPEMDVLEREGDRMFIHAVREHVKAFRVPCLAQGDAPARLQFEYVFRPDDRKVVQSEPLDPRAQERQDLAKCVRHLSGASAPDYPGSAARAEIQGRVRTRLRFFAPDQPPEIESFSRPAHDQLRAHVADWSRGLRMPCYQGEPVVVGRWYNFRMEGDTYGFKPGLTFKDLLPTIKGIREQKVAFDTRQMACPFDVELLYQQPDTGNFVGQVGNADASRRQFLQWLAAMQLDLPSQVLDSIYGDTVRFTVPCIQLNLQPKEKT
jgi:hypothetical protein